MSLFDAVRAVLASPAAADGGCWACTHFCTDDHRIEREMPGLAILSSASAAVRGRDGLCLAHDRLTNGVRRCPSFAAVPGARDQGRRTRSGRLNCDVVPLD